MDNRLQRRIQRYGWDIAADHYESGWRDSLAQAQKRLLDMAKPKRGETVLDIACGTGLVTFPIADIVGPAGHVIATDISSNMVMELQRTVHEKGYRNIEAFRADAEVLEKINDNSIDLVTCALGLMYIPDTEKALSEVKRVLKPGGRAVFAVWGARQNCGWADIFSIIDARVHSEVCPMFFRLGGENVLSLEMSEAGFIDITDERISTSLPYNNDEAALNAAFVGGPVALAYNRFDAQTKSQAHKEYLTSISAYKVSGRYEIPGEFVIGACYK